MSEYDGFKRKIIEKDAHVAVIGLGYVGLTVACALADVGFEVTGVDVDTGVVRSVNAGEWKRSTDEPTLPGVLRRVVQAGRLKATSQYEMCKYAEVVIIAVPTPVTKTHRADYKALESALRGVAENMTPGTLVSVESTLSPGTMHSLVLPALAASGLEHGADFWLAHCPERVQPGRLWQKLHRIPRIVGGITPEDSALAAELYRHICDDRLVLATALEAEVAKCAENAYWDVRLAFANELALACDDLGADVWQVRKLINSCAGRNVPRPGPGVGGTCIPKDPWLLLDALTIEAWLMREARKLNEWMPGHVARLVKRALEEAGVKPDGALVAVLGTAYRPNVGDTSNTPVGEVAAVLEEMGIVCRFHDPHVPGMGGDLIEVLDGADAALLAVAHDEYWLLDWRALGEEMRHKVLVDATGFVWPPPAGFIFWALGRRGQQ
jgi:UDP-N-acetyl-D-mannosaminuronic acid dehydrogenase